MNHIFLKRVDLLDHKWCKNIHKGKITCQYIMGVRPFSKQPFTDYSGQYEWAKNKLSKAIENNENIDILWNIDIFKNIDIF